MPVERFEKKRTVATLDGLRLGAALLVVFYHFLFMSWAEPQGMGGIRDMIGNPHVFREWVPLASTGWVGVEIFFVISGFVITLSAHGKTASQFAISRISRLFPALFFFATLAWLAVLSAGILPYDEAWIRYVRTVVLFPIGPWIDGAIWTLVAEVIFYLLIWTMLVLHLERSLGRFMRIALACNLVFWIGMVIGTALGHDLFALAASYKFRVSLISTSCFFLLGMFGQEMFALGASRSRFGLIGACLFCCLVSLYAMACNSTGALEFGQGPWLAIAVWVAFAGIGTIGLVWEWRTSLSPAVQGWLRQVGLLTYPLYLVNQISGAWLLGWLAAAGLPPFVAVLLAVFACVMISHLFARHAEPEMREVVTMMLGRWRYRAGRTGPQTS